MVRELRVSRHTTRHTLHVQLYTSHFTRHTSHVTSYTSHFLRILPGDTLHSLAQLIAYANHQATADAGVGAAFNRILLFNRPPPPPSAVEFLARRSGGLVGDLCWGKLCGLKQVLSNVLVWPPYLCSYCRLMLGSLRLQVAHVTHSVLPHTSLQPLSFVFDLASSSSEESLSLSSSANASLAFPDLLQLVVGKVVKLGVLRQLMPGFSCLDVICES
jgi:hypothetical protein